jgi:hypothetical protein
MGRKNKYGQCRFCLETDTIGNLISPCLCKGTFQYVHNECLLKWYSHASDRALHCNVCLKEYEKDYDIILESIRPNNENYTRCMKKPVYYIIISHSFMFFISKYLEFPVFYYILHFLYHLSHFSHFLTLVYNVKNRGLYRAYWLSSPRIFIPVFIMIAFCSMVATRILGAFTADILLYIALNEHYEVLSQINTSQKFFFKDLRRIK